MEECEALRSKACIHERFSRTSVPGVTGLVPGQVYDVQTQCKCAFGNASYVCQAWDAGYGYGLKVLYKSGYFVMGLTFLVSSFFVFAL